VELMENRIRPYAWGSRTAIADLLGEPSPAPHPQAELWIGAHPGDPSSLLHTDGTVLALADAVAADPEGQLGRAVTEQFGPRLPFLLKVLAAAEPLSLQAHPSQEQARQGYAAEDAAGIPLHDGHRNYRDTSHKPELICALTEFHALCGFRDPGPTVQVLAGLGVPGLDHYLSLLSGQPDEHGVRALFSSLITLPASVFGDLLDQVLAACVRRVREGSEFTREYRTTLELGERYPGDAGVLASLMMNRLVLEPGQAIYLPAGNLHAYLSGVGIELMANSDNVLRGGLTPKHVDVPELMRVLDFRPGPIEIRDPRPDESGTRVYPVPAGEFRLARMDLTGGTVTVDHGGPRILLVVDGTALVTDGSGRTLSVARGRSVWIPCSDGPVTVSGTGTAFLATDGL
jgi:mannose-6-phosphate isomerase